MNDEAFDQAVTYLCDQITRVYKEERRLVRAFGDLGAFTAVTCALALCSIQGGRFTLATVQRVVVPKGWASSRRIRALIDWLELENTAQRHAPFFDNRERPWSLNGWLVLTVGTLAEIYLAAASPWIERQQINTPEQTATVKRNLIDGVCWLLAHSQELPQMSDEMRMFLGHAPGFPLLLELLSAAAASEADGTGCEFSRKAAARAYGISRAHVTGLLAKAERLNYLKRTDSRLHLNNLTLRNVQRDLAYQLAFVVIWCEGMETYDRS
ncbi:MULTISPECIES: hypothetical protein [unclassified Rhizobium]|uniref:hypothetical protein n=1 Tax=unclassified Rhizobium TaxID=2613769 RepID=UPI000BC9A010|nr:MULTISPECIES: hypothetical protein [unclassified Rhizobium]MDH7808826.1 hypothetical protein [Rhizobium sp. AN67]MDQ4409136.1 hypothetical protein [Rhizobium sp. AN63]SOD51015.1 hypothetical protein SAMN05216595_0490 [Rhizobium sp. AN6A]